MTPIHYLALAIGLGLLTLSAALLTLAFKVARTLSITVQAPTALLPERVQMTLDTIDAKLTPAKMKPDDEKVASLIYEAVAMAETSKLKGQDRFNIAAKYVNERCDALNCERPDPRDLARRIEAAVAVNKKKR
jgi:hypothetical protein